VPSWNEENMSQPQTHTEVLLDRGDPLRSRAFTAGSFMQVPLTLAFSGGSTMESAFSGTSIYKDSPVMCQLSRAAS
jgi:hypothetical protein